MRIGDVSVMWSPGCWSKSGWWVVGCVARRSSIAGDAGEEVRNLDRLAQREIRLPDRTGADLPSGHDPNAELRPARARRRHQVPAVAVGEPNVGHEHVVGKRGGVGF